MHLFVCHVRMNTLSSSYTNPVNRSEIKLITGTVNEWRRLKIREEEAAKFRVKIWTRDLPNTKHERICSLPGMENLFFAKACPKILSCTHGNFEEQKVLESSIIISNYYIITAYYNYLHN